MVFMRVLKKQFQNNSRQICKRYGLSLLIMGALWSCSDDDDRPPLAEAYSDEAVTVPFLIANEEGNTPEDPGTLLFERRGQNPVLAPDGHQLTLAEFSTVKGNISVACLEEGTRVSLNLTGLIPNGVYTVWNVTFKAPGIDPSVPDFNQIGQGVIGPADGSDSDFTASAEGTAQISAITSGGPLSMFGNIANCPLLEEVEWHVVGAYHIDGKTYGPDLGPNGTAVEQFGFIFKKEEN